MCRARVGVTASKTHHKIRTFHRGVLCAVCCRRLCISGWFVPPLAGGCLCQGALWPSGLAGWLVVLLLRARIRACSSCCGRRCCYRGACVPDWALVSVGGPWCCDSATPAALLARAGESPECLQHYCACACSPGNRRLAPVYVVSERACPGSCGPARWSACAWLRFMQAEGGWHPSFPHKYWASSDAHTFGQCLRSCPVHVPTLGPTTAFCW